MTQTQLCQLIRTCESRDISLFRPELSEAGFEDAKAKFMLKEWWQTAATRLATMITADPITDEYPTPTQRREFNEAGYQGTDGSMEG